MLRHSGVKLILPRTVEFCKKQKLGAGSSNYGAVNTNTLVLGESSLGIWSQDARVALNLSETVANVKQNLRY
jgi:hypothetical protein